MKLVLFAACLLFATLATAAPADADLTRQVNGFVDAWHDDAAHARLAYFDKIAVDGIYIGTDRRERWQRDAFRMWARPYFEGKTSAWIFHATRRNVYSSADGALIWFDELLDTDGLGHCMASGVVRKTTTSFEIVHYQLSLAVPNESLAQLASLVHAAEAAQKEDASTAK